MKEIQTIGIDIGRGYTKGYTVFNNKEYECLFKSVVSFGRQIDFDNYNEPIYLELNGEEYFAGELAEKEGYNQIANNMHSKVTSTAEKLFFAVVSKLAKTENIRVMLGVPNQQFSKKTLDEVRKFYLHKTVSVKDKINNTTKKVYIEDINIFREADSALIWSLKDKPNQKPTGMVTIGFRTTEFAYFEKNMQFIDKNSKTVELGNKTSLEYIQRELSNNGIFKELYEIDSNVGDYDELKKRAYSMLYERVLQELDNFWINSSEMDIIFSGGTSINLPKLENVIDNPQMCTARGLYLVGTQVGDRNEKK